jgi:glucose/arabinose dehydrogenase
MSKPFHCLRPILTVYWDAFLRIHSMTRKLPVLTVLACVLLGAGWQAGARHDLSSTLVRRIDSPAVDVEPLPPGARIEAAFPNNRIRNPVSMVFAPDGRWFFTERTTGLVRLVTGDQFLPVYQAPVVGDVRSERGLLGITLDPSFAANGYAYIYYTGTTGGSQIENRVERFTLQGSTGISPTLLLTVPLDDDQVKIHNGGNLHFGPDGKLYVSIGDYFDDANGQDIRTMPAKIHRFAPTVPLSAPTNNPFHDGSGPNADSIYAYGFRNPFDFDFDPVSGAIFAGDNGVACDDEVNRVLSGYNYGWRTDYPSCDDAGPGGPDPATNTIPPLFFWSSSVAPTGVTFYHGDLFPEWKNDLFVCHWKSGELHRFKLNGARDAIASHTILADVVCHVDVETGGDGALYFFRNDPNDPDREYRYIERITRDATVYASTFAPSTPIPASGDALTYTMRLVHYGTLTTTFSITSGLPPSTTLVGGSPQAGGGAIVGSSSGITWTGSITPNTTLTASYRVTVSDQIAAPALLSSTMVISTAEAGVEQRTAVVIVNGRAVYLPIMLRAYVP